MMMIMRCSDLSNLDGRSHAIAPRPVQLTRDVGFVKGCIAQIG